VVLEDPVPMLADWSHFYSYGKNRVVSFLAPSQDSAAILDDLIISLDDLGLSDNYAVSLLAAINRLFGYVRSEQVHLYVAAESFERSVRALQARMRLHRVAEGGNIHFMRPYYRNSAMFGARSMGNMQLVSDVQLYLDIQDFPVRGREAAELLVSKRLGPSLGLSPSQQQRLLSA
jgi:hypothetical protein